MASFVTTCRLTSRLATKQLRPEIVSRGYRASPACLAKVESTLPKSQTYPLLPSVEYLIHEHGLDASAVEKMTPSGPNGRLLKGDVLAFLGSISASYPTELSSRIDKLTHLDLSNIKLAAAPPAQPQAAAPASPEPAAAPPVTEIAAPISMTRVLEVQKRIQSTLGVQLPLSTFIVRATDLANDDLPRSTSAKPSADELFNAVLGLDQLVPSGVRGNFLPQVTALPRGSGARRGAHAASSDQIDIIDVLAGNGKGSRTVSASSASKSKSDALSGASSLIGPGAVAATNIFAVTVPKGEERRARVFLERVRAVLEDEPGRLVL